jgi:hypothetical protein
MPDHIRVDQIAHVQPIGSRPFMRRLTPRPALAEAWMRWAVVGLRLE